MSRPNLLYIFTDQQRADTMQCYGNGQIETPSLNALARESFVFDHAYVSQPVCSPSRATMMTGLWPHTAGVPACNVPLPAEVPTFAEMLPDDYCCAYMGKWHLGDEIFAQHGFDTWVGSENSYRHSYSDPERLSRFSDYYHFLAERGFEPDAESLGSPVFSRHMEASMEEDLTKATFLGDRAAQYIRDNRDRPFALCVSYLEPHSPHTGPLNEFYDPSSLPTGPAFMQKPAENVPLIVRLMAAIYMESEEYGCDLRTEEGWREVMTRYWGNTTLVDRSVANILGALDDAGLEWNDIEVVAGADIVSCCTNASRPVFEGDWLEPGQMVVTVVNSDVTFKRNEVDETTFARATDIVVNDWASVESNGQVELLDPIEKGLVDRTRVFELGDLLAGKIELRQTNDNLLFYKNNTGLGMQFAAAGAVIYNKIKDQKSNREVPREWLASEEYSQS